VQRRLDALKMTLLAFSGPIFALFCSYNYAALSSARHFNDKASALRLDNEVSSSFINLVHQQSFVLESSLPDDFSLASHVLLLDSNNSFYGFLPLLGLMLVITMIIAILVTQRTKTSYLAEDKSERAYWPRRWT
jgi:hypothetical protein